MHRMAPPNGAALTTLNSSIRHSVRVRTSCGASPAIALDDTQFGQFAQQADVESERPLYLGMESHALVVGQDAIIGFPPRHLKTEAKLARDVPDQVAEGGAIAGDLAAGQVIIQWIVNTVSPM